MSVVITKFCYSKLFYFSLEKGAIERVGRGGGARSHSDLLVLFWRAVLNTCLFHNYGHVICKCSETSLVIMDN